MSKKQAQLDQSLNRIAEAIDRESSVQVSVQLRGALEFGIASGELPAGARLPSVRVMAARLGISPVTVSTVYATLQEGGHLEGRVGSGTFVSAGAAVTCATQLRKLDELVAELIRVGKQCGFSADDLATRVSTAQSRKRRALRMMMLGNFHDATEAYAAALRPRLAEGDEIVPGVLSELRGAPPQDIDLVVAPRTLLGAARELFPGVAVYGLTLIPDEATRVSLASLPTEARVVGYSYFPEFVTIMKAGIRRFAPHVSDVSMAVRGEPGAEALIAEADVLVYATGTDYLRDNLRPGQTGFEYRHTPDNQSIRTELLPAIEDHRLRLTSKKED
ncbi:GntR family transcriptional regulator (plasmid) [Alloyangia pacifica]|uniref:GntR family transcriptional regulator n=1 Tax=Alloyangia pacifica TaxID=311180 RepID=A0A2U8HJX9_9RHOB|nr:GntR family transcriptional regulator [Alloyangia pacifica]AWI86051.1 GntR family transcriptional regulator [Alloyangia pacifica]